MLIEVCLPAVSKQGPAGQAMAAALFGTAASLLSSAVGASPSTAGIAGIGLTAIAAATMSFAGQYTASNMPCLQAAMLDQLPYCSYTDAQLQVGRMGLHTLKSALAAAAMAFVNQQLAMYEEWRTSPIMLSRPPWVDMLERGTFGGHRGQLLQLLGYIHTHQNVSQPRLEHFLNGNLILHFIDFERQRGVGPKKLAEHVRNARYVAAWLYITQFTPEQKWSNLWLYVNYQDKMEALTQQCSRHLRPDPQKLLKKQRMLEERSAVTAEHLVVLMQGLWNQAADMIPDLDHGSKEDKIEAASYIMKVGMLSLCFGFLPPIREFIIINLMLPTYDGPCLHQNCQHASRCPGNRVTYVHSQDERVGLKLEAMHHKTSKHAHSSKPLSVPLPWEVYLLLEAIITRCRRVIVAALPAKDRLLVTPHLFLWPSTGKPVKAQQVSQLFKQMVMPEMVVKFGPQWCRTIFVGERCSSSRVDVGMSDEAAARVMGTSLRVWETEYDKFKAARQIAEVQKAMPGWRKELLAKMNASESYKTCLKFLRQHDLPCPEGVELSDDNSQMDEPEWSGSDETEPSEASWRSSASGKGGDADAACKAMSEDGVDNSSQGDESDVVMSDSCHGSESSMSL